MAWLIPLLFFDLYGAMTVVSEFDRRPDQGVLPTATLGRGSRWDVYDRPPRAGSSFFVAGAWNHFPRLTSEEEILSVIPLFSPGPKHNSEVLVTGVCTTRANSGKSECRTSTTLSGRGQGRSSTNAALRCWSGRGKRIVECRSAHLGACRMRGVVPERPVAPHQVAGMTPRVGPSDANGAPA